MSLVTSAATPATECDKAAELQWTHGLLIDDSLNPAVGPRSGLNLLATADPQFDSVPGITVFKPQDL